MEQHSIINLLLELDKLPLLSPSIHKILNPPLLDPDIIERYSFVDEKSLMFNETLLEQEFGILRHIPVDCLQDPTSLDDKVTSVLPVCDILSYQCHSHVMGIHQEEMDALVTNNISTNFLKTVWSGCDFHQLISDAALTRSCALMMVTARLEWIFSCLVSRRLQLKDNLNSTEMFDKLGYLSLIFQCSLGCVKGSNTKNLTWHGFISLYDIPRRFFSMLFCTVLNLNYKLSQMKLKPRPSVDVPPFITLPALQTHQKQFGAIISNSSIVHPQHRTFWHHLMLLRGSAKEPFISLNLNVVLLQHALRRLWIVLAGSDCSRSTAQCSELYITFDEIFSPTIHTDVPRPGASYFASVYNKSIDEASCENVLIPVVGLNTFHALLDLFIHGAGIRLRDKLSHGELFATNDSLCNLGDHLLYVSMSIMSRFCPNVDDESIFSFCDPYQHQFHPAAIIASDIMETSVVASDLDILAKKSEEYPVVEAGSQFNDTIDNFCTKIKTIQSGYTTSPLFIGPLKIKFYNLLQQIFSAILLFSQTLREVLHGKLVLLENHKLRSRQRTNLMIAIGILPGVSNLLKSMGLVSNILICKIEALKVVTFEENVSFVKLLKDMLKCFENCTSLSQQSKWQDIGFFLTDFSSRGAGELEKLL